MDKLANIGTDYYGYDHILTKQGGISLLTGSILNNVFMLAGLILVIVIIYSGFLMISGSGDPQSYAKAQQTLTAGIVGFIIVVAAWLIVKLIEATTGTKIL